MAISSCSRAHVSSMLTCCSREQVHLVLDGHLMQPPLRRHRGILREMPHHGPQVEDLLDLRLPPLDDLALLVPQAVNLLGLERDEKHRFAIHQPRLLQRHLLEVQDVRVGGQALGQALLDQEAELREATLRADLLQGLDLVLEERREHHRDRLRLQLVQEGLQFPPRIVLLDLPDANRRLVLPKDAVARALHRLVRGHGDVLPRSHDGPQEGALLDLAHATLPRSLLTHRQAHRLLVDLLALDTADVLGLAPEGVADGLAELGVEELLLDLLRPAVDVVVRVHDGLSGLHCSSPRGLDGRVFPNLLGDLPHNAETLPDLLPNLVTRGPRLLVDDIRPLLCLLRSALRGLVRPCGRGPGVLPRVVHRLPRLLELDVLRLPLSHLIPETLLEGFPEPWPRLRGGILLLLLLLLALALAREAPPLHLPPCRPRAAGCAPCNPACDSAPGDGKHSPHRPLPSNRLPQSACRARGPLRPSLSPRSAPPSRGKGN
mmetsp:Transcript_29945/g.73694  ORF Transcript_29945/g.73694 Transcript_29945/m.73694 type:complete len:489 (+) Transcript_29945:332-1798(+)